MDNDFDLSTHPCSVTTHFPEAQISFDRGLVMGLWF
ncbi:hypothetical protein NKDENANG_03465 [Candidatus Entotheonellaceae bacterium PAL068K]